MAHGLTLPLGEPKIGQKRNPGSTIADCPRKVNEKNKKKGLSLF
jgi:hypothetical protein